MTIGEKLKKQKKYFPIHIYGSAVRNKLDELKEYLIVLESMFKKELNGFGKWLDKLTSEMTEEQKEILSEQYAEDYWKLQRDFPKIHRSSILVSICSYMEAELV